MRVIVSLAILMVSLFGFTPSNATPQTPSPTDFATSGLNGFAFDIYHQIGKSEQNIIFSPYSLSSLLVILTEGSAGNTRAQLMQLLHLKNNPLNQVMDALDQVNVDLKLKNSCSGWLHCKIKKMIASVRSSDDTQDFILANALWADKNLTYKKEFLTEIDANHFIHFYRLNFQHQPDKSRIKINDWVEENTNDYIKELLPVGSITNSTRLVLTNAIYFKASWELPFKPERTQQKDFILQNNNKIQVSMMQQHDDFVYAENDVLQMLRLPYRKSTLAMAVLLPKPNHTLQEIISALNPQTFAQWLQTEIRQNVAVSLPKFKIESTFDQLKTTLINMGLTDAFNEKANFSPITDDTLVVSDVIQKALIQVDERGTIAAAATAATMFGTAAPSRRIEFNANHPFLFIIFDTQSKLVLFMGQVTNPTEAV